MAAPDNAALVGLMYDAFNNNNLDAFLAYISADVELVLMPFDLHFHGLEGFREFLQRVKIAFPDCTAKLVNQVSHETGVINEFIVHGTHTGPLIGPHRQFPATGRVMTFGACDVWEVTNGRLTKLRSYFDRLTILRQLEVTPAA